MNVTRRQLLKGISLGTGGMLFSPILQALAAQAAGGTQLPKRFVFVLQPNGIQPWAFYPEGGDLPSFVDDNEKQQGTAGATFGKLYKQPERVTVRSLDPYRLPEDIEPLTPFKDRLLLIQGLNGVHANPGHSAGFAALAGTSKKPTPQAESIDVALGRANPGIFPLVNLGIAPGQRHKVTMYATSAYGPGLPAPTQCRPELAYELLFGSVAEGSAKKEFRKREQLLDFVQEDVRQLNGRLAAPEREKLGYYLNALESMHQRQAQIKAMEASLKKGAPTIAKTELSTEVIASQFEIGAAALICGLTNVLTIVSGCCSLDGIYTGLTTTGVHAVGHCQGDDKRNGIQLNRYIRNFHFQHVAKLMKKLQDIPEGDGTMLDNTLFVCTSDNADYQHTSGRNWPFLLAGNIGKRLKTGRLIEYPAYGAKGNRTINALYATLLEVAGKPRDHFNLEGTVKEVDVPGPLSDLLS